MCVPMNKMRDDQDFNIHFVKIIERERSLYDKSLPEYRSKEEHERIWQKISTEVNESVAHCKERWRNLRACLTRHLKQQQSSTEDGSVNHKPYYLAEHMSFLLPYTKSRSVKEQIKYETPAIEEHKPSTSTKISKVNTGGGTTTTTYTISTAESDENQYVTLIQSSTGELTPADGLDETHLQVETTTETESKIIPEQSYTTASAVVTPKEIIYEPVPSKRIKLSHQESDEADLDFFRSLLPDTRLMTASQKRRFKMGIFGLIDNVLTNNDINS
ncbi:uncharacterized protein LOC129564802 [Sitodiplosis mosellana]|uniref:uncharacterized protein LOC129564802 n=1 Tax=Sitodiplosis mosellana TaxID=263140 RepID=UPI002444C641|nr:uncharacterized protein LOC129564802 [Sitodiplosis mosellana]